MQCIIRDTIKIDFPFLSETCLEQERGGQPFWNFSQTKLFQYWRGGGAAHPKLQKRIKFHIHSLIGGIKKETRWVALMIQLGKFLGGGLVADTNLPISSLLGLDQK